MKGQDILNKSGFNVTIKRVSKNGVTSGCGYGIIITKDVDKAINILEENGIKVIDNIPNEGDDQ